MICKTCEQDLPESSFYKKGEGRFTSCIVCTKAKTKKSKDIKYSIEHAAHVFKVFSSRGFFSKDEVDEYQIIKSDYLAQSGRALPKIDERIKRARIK